MTLSYNEVS